MRRLLAAAVAIAALSACGDSPAPSAAGSAPAVVLRLASPPDLAVIRAGSVEIRGTVRPSNASVEVLGREVPVDGGAFRARVTLEPGANLVDVAASARGRRPDFAATRVVREERLAVPAVVGRDAEAARNRLEALGLEVVMEDAGGFLDSILPGDPQVCDMRPAPGAGVLPGETVTLLVARDC